MASRETVLREGERRLREWGVAADAGVGALRAVAGRDPAADVAIAARLGGLADPASVEALHALEAARPGDRLVQREVRRALYRLQQRGVAAAARAPVAAPSDRPVDVTPPLEGYLSPVDGAGDQLVWIVRPVPGGILYLLAVVNDPEGLREVGLTETTRKALREARESLQARHDLRMVEADAAYCDFVILRGLRWAAERGQTVAGDYPQLRLKLTSRPPLETAEPLIRRHLDVDAVRADAAALEASAALLDEPEFRTWVLGPELLGPYLDELRAVRDSPLVLPEAQREERFRSVVDRAVAEVFAGELQASWARRLEEMAWVLHVTGRPERARSALAAALALAASDRGGHGIPFCERLARASLAALWELESRREAERARESLVLTPREAALEAERQRRRG